jgi:hypothetical protein
MSVLVVSHANAGAGDSLLLADFPASTREQPWFVVNDGVMGGRSEGGFRLGESALVFSGVTNTNGGGFS